LADSSFRWLSSHADSLQQRDNVCWWGTRTLDGRNIVRDVSYLTRSIAPGFQFLTPRVFLALRHRDGSAHCVRPALNAATHLALKASISLWVDQDVLEWFKAQGASYQTRINTVLRAFHDASV
jgi:uncharacterized protein (DUF4415 family)